MTIEDSDERVEEILAQRAADGDLARLFGPNWRNVIVVIKQAANLSREQAEEIAAYPQHPNWDLELEEAHKAMLQAGLVAWPAAGEALDAAADHTFLKGGPFWEAHDAFCRAFTASLAGDLIPDGLRNDMMRAWGTAF